MRLGFWLQEAGSATSIQLARNGRCIASVIAINTISRSTRMGSCLRMTLTWNGISARPGIGQLESATQLVAASLGGEVEPENGQPTTKIRCHPRSILGLVLRPEPSLEPVPSSQPSTKNHFSYWIGPTARSMRSISSQMDLVTEAANRIL